MRAPPPFFYKETNHPPTDEWVEEYLRQIRILAEPRSKRDYIYLLLHMIPPGCLVTYKALAVLANTSPRAIGSLMRSNKLLVVVPCHRVIKSDGSMGGFSRGLEVKRKLLAVEGVTSTKYSKCIIRSDEEYWSLLESTGQEVDYE